MLVFYYHSYSCFVWLLLKITIIYKDQLLTLLHGMSVYLVYLPLNTSLPESIYNNLVNNSALINAARKYNYPEFLGRTYDFS
jgi:hypothetical protein